MLPRSQKTPPKMAFSIDLTTESRFYSNEKSQFLPTLFDLHIDQFKISDLIPHLVADLTQFSIVIERSGGNDDQKFGPIAGLLGGTE
jgi:hypothetical protein